MKLKQLDMEDLGTERKLFVKIFSQEPWNDCWDDPEQLRRYMEELLGTPNALCLGLFEDDVLVGISLGRIRHWYQGTEYWIDELGIDPERQGMGAGRRFLELIDGDLRKREVAAVVLLTDRRVPAYRFYQKNGFTEQAGQVLFAKHLR